MTAISDQIPSAFRSATSWESCQWPRTAAARGRVRRAGRAADRRAGRARILAELQEQADEAADTTTEEQRRFDEWVEWVTRCGYDDEPYT